MNSVLVRPHPFAPERARSTSSAGSNWLQVVTRNPNQLKLVNPPPPPLALPPPPPPPPPTPALPRTPSQIRVQPHLASTAQSGLSCSSKSSRCTSFLRRLDEPGEGTRANFSRRSCSPSLLCGSCDVVACRPHRNRDVESRLRLTSNHDYAFAKHALLVCMTLPDVRAQEGGDVLLRRRHDCSMPVIMGWDGVMINVHACFPLSLPNGTETERTVWLLALFPSANVEQPLAPRQARPERAIRTLGRFGTRSAFERTFDVRPATLLRDAGIKARGGRGGRPDCV